MAEVFLEKELTGGGTDKEVLIIKRAGKEDLVDITGLEAICFKGEDPWSYEAFYNEIVTNTDRTLYLAAQLNGETVGYMGVWQILDEGHITNVAVSPDHRRRHIGEAIIRTMLDETFKAGIRSWTLEARVDNEAAIRLYEKMGFRREGIRRKYYAYDGTDVLIMWKGHEE